MAEVASLGMTIDASQVAPALDGLKKLETQGRNTENAVNDLSAAFKFLAGAMVVREAVEAAKNVVMLAARYETLGATLTVMGNNIGKTTDEMRAFQQDLENTGISAIKARNSLQIMAAAHIDVSKAAALGRVAQDAAVLANIDSSTAFQNLVRGIATGESRIIRHMGIMVNFGVAIDQYAKAHGRLASSYTSTERAQIRLDAALAEGSKRAGVYEAAMTTAGKQMLSMVRYTENLQVHIGEMFNPATNAVVFSMVEAMKQMAAATKEWAASGGQAVAAQQIKEYAQSLFGTFRDSIVFVKDHITAIRRLGETYLAAKLTGYILSAAQSTKLWIASIQQAAAVRLDEVRSVVLATQAKAVEAASDLAQLEAQNAAMGSRFRAIAFTDRLTAARVRAAAANEAAAVSEAELALAMNKTNVASALGGNLMSALGGPIGVAVFAVVGLVFAYKELKNTVLDDMELSNRAAASKSESLYEETRRFKEYTRILKTEGKAAATAVKQALELDALPAVKNLNEQFLVAQQRLQDLSTTARSSFKGILQDIELGIANNAVSQFLSGRPMVVGTNNIRAREIDDLKRAMQENRRLVDLNKQRELQERAADKEAHDATKRQEEAMAAKETKYRTEISLQKELIGLNEKILEQANKGLGYSKTTQENLKAQLDYEKGVLDVYAEVAEKQRGGKLQSGELSLYKDKLALLSALKDSTIAANNELEIRRRQHDADTLAENDYSDMVKAIHKVTESSRIKKLTEQEEMYLRIKANETDAVKINNLELEYNAGVLLNKVIADRNKTEKEAEAYAEQLNKNKRDGDTNLQLERLNQAKNTGKLIGDVYTKAWIDIMMKGDTATAYIVQGTSKLFDALGTALGNFVTGTKTSFSDLMRSLADELARFYAQKAVMALFQFVIGAYVGSGDGGLGNPTGNSNGSIVGGGKAYGGSVSAGMAYPVGEKGPEMFYPGVSGQIVPNSGGGGIIVQNYLTIKTDGSSDKSTSTDSRGHAIGNSIFALMDQWAIKEKRPNGLLDMKATR